MNEGGEVKKQEHGEVVGQSGTYPVTRVPLFTTKLPFFYHTKKKTLLAEDIHYEGTDDFGHPVVWEVMPNRSRQIGAPGIDAYEVWRTLVKPVMNAFKKKTGNIPEVLPLGGIRECLRAVGWTEGGWTARRLIKGLMQTGHAVCNIDFLLPTPDLNGEKKFVPVKGSYTRFSLWKIGSKHLTEEELSTGNFKFDFDLDDTVYIQLHKVERQIQSQQDHKPLDNEYMKLLSPSAKRWYELTVEDVFGVVKNGGVHGFEVKYSDYVKAHHTLSRQTIRWKVVQQMTKVIKDHLASRYIDHVEYRTIKQPGVLIDFLIRYYPGEGARESVRRISQAEKKIFGLFEAKPRRPQKKKDADLKEFSNNHTEQFDFEAEAIRAQFLLPAPAVAEIPAQLIEALTNRGVMGASELLKKLPPEALDRATDVIEYWDEIRAEKGAGLLVNLIKSTESLPATFESSRERKRRQVERERRERLQNAKEFLEFAYSDYQREALDQYIKEHLSDEEYKRRIEAEIRKTVPPLWMTKPSPQVIEHLAEKAVRFEIVKEVAVMPFDEFCRREAKRVLSRHGIDPAELGIVTAPAAPAGETLLLD